MTRWLLSALTVLLMQFPFHALAAQQPSFEPLECFEDRDGDGFGSENPAVCGSDEASDIDGDCDDDDPDEFPGQTWYPDCDDDGAASDNFYIACSLEEADFNASACVDSLPPRGGWYFYFGFDCDDEDAGRFVGNAEIPDDGIDQDCDGIDTVTCYEDRDEDGYGSDSQTIILAADGSCDTDQQESDNFLDCDDSRFDANPSVAEIWYDGVDNDCDGSNDYDQDGDSYVSEDHHGAGGGTAPNEGDCNDTNNDINPGAAEIPGNGVDEDCDGIVDQACWNDADGDGYGDPATPVQCGSTGSDADNDLDCADDNKDISPDTIWYPDSDGDGFGDRNDVGLRQCTQPPEWLLTNEDCNDDNKNINPGAQEIAGDGVDQDCDGLDYGYDDDNDTVPSKVEDLDGDGDPGNDDSDNDNTANYLDPDDDNDGLPTRDEDPDGDGDPTNDNSDGNGLPNYLDPDDDGDSVPTELEDIGGDGDPRNDDTDEDKLPDYLDPDDDGDGIPTMREDPNGDGDPTNDDSDDDEIPDYLDKDSPGPRIFDDGFEDKRTGE